MTHVQIQKGIIAVLLSPLSLLYGVGISIRNLLYDAEIIKPSKFSIPLISVGNLAIGGAGKTPHIEYLIRLLNPYINVATLSRGYNRTTTGFRFVSPHDTANVSGDEPLMYARKFPDIAVAVAENRSLAIPQMMRRFPNINTILLDDAYQHRTVEPFINILLTQYESLFTDDYLMPSGRLREWRTAYKRASCIVVTKCPEFLSSDEKNRIIKKINPLKHQKIFFSKYRYGQIYQFYHTEYRMEISKEHDVMLISAIANTSYLTQYLKIKSGSFFSVEFADHHNFIFDDIQKIIKDFNNRASSIKYILTTEKDAVRLLPFRKYLYENAIPIFVLPIEVEFLDDDGPRFDSYIKDTLMSFEV